MPATPAQPQIRTSPMKIISVSEMRRLERESNVPPEQLMQTAGENACAEILRFAECTLSPRHRQRYVVVAGKGNNGGDALVVAKCLHRQGYPVEVFSTCPLSDYSGTAASQATSFPQDIPYTVVTEKLPNYALRIGTVVVDGLLGIGTTGNARGVVAELIRQINASALPVCSLDTPSGLECDKGSGDPIISAALTVTMAYPKTGLFCGQGPEAAGLVRVVPIGLQKDLDATTSDDAEAFTEQDAVKLLMRRPLESHKNSFGHALCIAGSAQYPGAPFLAAEAALRGGAGLVTLAIPSAAVRRSGPAALILSAIGDANHGMFSLEDWSQLAPLLERSNALIYGPGTGSDVDSAFIAKLLAVPKPLVIDADGIRTVAKTPTLLQQMASRQAPTLLTPHPGEMAALLKGLNVHETLSRLEQAKTASRLCNAFVLLKGHNSVSASPSGELSINTSGGPALATAGTGDVLAGLMTAFLAQQLPPYDAMRLAAYIHGHAADIACLAPRAMIADDLLSLIPKALADISPWG
ncbi:MAG: NAD(P)H-hydrate dehydratase [Victivallales bacterium]|nr:NAD(P)H-hydrate dehydratase [Victivallales bacterium]